MVRLLPRRFQHRGRPAGLLLAAVAMASQLAFAAMVPPLAPSEQVAALAALSVLCHGQPPPPDRPAPSHHVPLVALCPLRVASALGPAILSAAPGLPPAPAALNLRIAAASPVRAPPIETAHAAYPRGPPVPV